MGTVPNESHMHGDIELLKSTDITMSNSHMIVIARDRILTEPSGFAIKDF
jgi:hypothetical protein